MEKLKKVLPVLLGAVVGLVAGFLIVRVTAPEAGDGTVNYLEGFLLFASVLVGLFVGLYFHIIAHEAGHFIAAKISGYKFVLFRIGSIALVRKDNKLAYKKYSLAGTGGQCLMSPPDVTDESYKYPIIFYNLFGGIVNILLSTPFIIAGILTSGFLSSAFFVFAFVGILAGLTNLIPLKISGIANDGLNAISCGKNLKSRRAFWIQMKFAELMTQSVRPRDIPKDWVEGIGVPDDVLVGFLTNLRCGYLLDRGEIEQASDYAKSVIENPGKTLELHLNELRGEVLFYELIGLCRPEEIEKMYTKELQAHFKQLSTHTPAQRLTYAYELLYKKDEAKASKALANFEKACLNTPFGGEVAGERELVELVKDRGTAPMSC